MIQLIKIFFNIKHDTKQNFFIRVESPLHISSSKPNQRCVVSICTITYVEWKKLALQTVEKGVVIKALAERHNLFLRNSALTSNVLMKKKTHQNFVVLCRETSYCIILIEQSVLMCRYNLLSFVKNQSYFKERHEQRRFLIKFCKIYCNLYCQLSLINNLS